MAPSKIIPAFYALNDDLVSVNWTYFLVLRGVTLDLRLSSQLVPESTRTQVNSYPFWSTRTYFLVNSYGQSQLVPILVNSYPFWSTRTQFGQLVPGVIERKIDR